MRFLFVHQNFPGQFLHLVRSLAAQQKHELVFITQPNTNVIPGVMKLNYQPASSSSRTHHDARDFEAATRRAEAVARSAMLLRDKGFKPDIIVGHAGWGEMLNMADVWPAIPRVMFREYFYHLTGADVGFDSEFPVMPAQWPRIRAKNTIGLLDLLGNDPGVTSTLWQRSLFPGWAQPAIRVIPDGVDLETCCPGRDEPRDVFQFGAMRVEPGMPLLTYVARDLEPYRGFHILMRALPSLMREHPALRVICLGGDGVSYGMAPRQGSWRACLLDEVGAEIDAERIYFPGKVAYDQYVRLLQRSDVHAYLSYPFIASWSLREAMACGCAIVASDVEPVREFIDHGRTGRLVSALDPHALADAISQLLVDPPARTALGRAARAKAVQTMSIADHLAGWSDVMNKLTGSSPATSLN